MSATVVLIRPCCSDFDEQNRVQGRIDLPLNARGEAQLLALAEQLATTPMQLIYTSPCEPARSTAVALGEGLQLPVRELGGLENLDHGLWQGMEVEDLRRKQPKVFRQWQESPETVCPPQGETLEAAWERVRGSLEKPLRRGIPFGLVLPEPLATLVAGVLTGRRIDLTETLCCEQRLQPRWEILNVVDPVPTMG